MPHRLNIADLSERELQVLELSIQGMTDKSIAAELGLSVATVHTYWIRMKNKLGGATRAEVVAAAMSRSVNRTMAENQRLIQEVMRRAAVEEDLMRSQNVLQSIIDAAPDLIYLKDSSGRYEAVNTTFAASVGLTADEIIGKTDFDLYPEEEARRYQLSDRKVLQTGELWEADDDSTVEGERRTFHTIKFPIFDSTGNAESVGGISRDITRRKDLENRAPALSAPAQGRIRSCRAQQLGARLGNGPGLLVVEHRSVARNGARIVRRLLRELPQVGCARGHSGSR